MVEDAGRALLLRAGQSPPEPRSGNGARRERRPLESHTKTQVGSREESTPPNTWTESGRTSVLHGIVYQPPVDRADRGNSGRLLVGGPCSNPSMHEVVAAALLCEGRVLLVHRSPNRRAYPGTWDLPGGHVETGETELAALTREIHEELGVQISAASVVHLCRVEAGRAREQLRLSAWLVHEWQGTPTNVAPNEHDEIRWFQLEELPPFAHELVGTALADVMRDDRV